MIGQVKTTEVWLCYHHSVIVQLSPHVIVIFINIGLRPPNAVIKYYIIFITWYTLI